MPPRFEMPHVMATNKQRPLCIDHMTALSPRPRPCRSIQCLQVYALPTCPTSASRIVFHCGSLQRPPLLPSAIACSTVTLPLRHPPTTLAPATIHAISCSDSATAPSPIPVYIVSLDRETRPFKRTKPLITKSTLGPAHQGFIIACTPKWGYPKRYTQRK